VVPDRTGSEEAEMQGITTERLLSALQAKMTSHGLPVAAWTAQIQMTRVTMGGQGGRRSGESRKEWANSLEPFVNGLWGLQATEKSI